MFEVLFLWVLLANFNVTYNNITVFWDMTPYNFVGRYQTARHHIPEAPKPNTQCCDNLRLYASIIAWFREFC
jgi:hypothetical protein